MKRSISIDPGNAKRALRVCYAALWCAKTLTSYTTLTRTAARRHRKLFGPIDVVAIEKPQQDRRSRKVPPSVLIGLAWNGALVASALDPEELVEMTPTEWKGSIDKHAHHLQIWQKLTDEERALFPDGLAILTAAAETYARTGKETKHQYYDFFDAVGVGLVLHGRMRRAGSHRE